MLAFFKVSDRIKVRISTPFVQARLARFCECIARLRMLTISNLIETVTTGSCSAVIWSRLRVSRPAYLQRKCWAHYAVWR